MTQRALREEQSATVIEPFVEEWLDRAGSHFSAFRNCAVGQVLWDENLSDEQIEEAVAVDGSGDMGIDAWYLSNEDSTKVLYLIQSKDTRANKNDLDKLKNGFLDLFHPAKSVNANSEVRTRAAELRSELDDDLTIEMHLVTSRLVARTLRSDGKPLWSEDISLLGRTFPAVYYVHDVESLAANLRVIQEHPITARFQLGKNQYFEYTTKSNFRTVSAAIRADSLALLFNQNRLNLFRLNPRYFLTTKNVVNREILETLDGEYADNFYLYNNGVTATCSAIKRGVGSDSVLEFHDFQIVNGCQTTVTIFERWKQAGGAESLETVRVPIRIIETQAAKQIAEQVARTTNRQNQMKQEDFRSGDKLHEKLQAEFNKMNPRWFYEYKRGTWNTDFRSARARAPYTGEPYAPRRIQMKDLAQACLAFQRRPDASVDKVSSYFTSEDRYRQMFPTTCQAQQLLLPYVLFLKANEIAKNRKDKYEWSTSYLRYPMVSCVSQALRYLLDESHTSYFGTDVSANIMSTLDEWAPQLFPLAFDELVKFVDKEAHSGRGVRAAVRRIDWLDEVYDAIQHRIDATLNAEKQVANMQGMDPNNIGLRKMLPTVI